MLNRTPGRFIRAVFILLLGIVTLGACSSLPAASESDAQAAQTLPPFANQRWYLVQIQSMDDRVFKPKPGVEYSFELNVDGWAVVADCNRGRGMIKWTPPSGLMPGPIAMTRAVCPPGSLSQRYVQNLGFVRSFVLQDGRLFLATMADGAILEFSRSNLVAEGA